MVEAFCAAGKSGVVLVPLNARLTAPELKDIILDSGMHVLMYGEGFEETARALKEVASLREWISLHPSASGLESDYRRLIGTLGDSDWKRAECEPEDLYCLLYTSGTTGKPKGVMIPHRMAAWNAHNTAICWELGPTDVAPVFTPMYHAGGLAVFLTSIFLVGGTIVLHRGFDASEVWRAIERERATVVFGVPTIFKMLMEAPEFLTVDLSSVRWCISGGAPLPLYLIEAYQRRGIVFKQGYGMTEVGVNCFSMTVEQSKRKIGSIGKPMMFTEARLVDGNGQEVSAGEIGELWLRGPHVCQGYWNNPRATAEALDANGWFHTGDLARRDADGFFYIAGRQKDMIISGGVNVYPAEIEAELLLHPEVRDAAVIGVPDQTWGEKGIAFVVRSPGATLSAEVLGDYLSQRLAKFKIPKAFMFVESLPRTPYGKVLKTDLRQRYLHSN